MTDPTPASPTPPKRSSRWLKGLLGCLGVCLLLCCGVVSLSGYGLYHGLAFIQEERDRQAERETAGDVDRLFKEALADGDAGAIYERADPRLRDEYSREEFLDAVGTHPTLFTRTSLSGRFANTRWYGDGTYRMIRLVLRETGKTLEFICRITPGGQWILVGVVPLLDRAVPDDLKAAFAADMPSGVHHGRRHHH